MFGLAERAIKHWRILLGAAALMLLTAACIVDTPGIENTQVGGDQPTAVAPTVAAVVPAFEPTAVPAPPTPAAQPTSTPVPTSTPAPVDPPVAGPTPLPTADPNDAFVPNDVPAGPVAIPVAGTSFVLAEPRPILQLAGHTLVYIDQDLLAEVDIFTPIADRDGNSLASYPEIIQYIKTDVSFGGLQELDAVSIAGSPTRVFDGTTVVKPEAPERAFVTDPAGLTNDQLGWFPPTRARLWVIDAPSGPLMLSAESLEDPGQFEDALDLATEILSTINFD